MSDQGLPPPASPLSRALWNFSSQWFLVPQGTGIIAVILDRLEYQFNGLMILAKIVWIYTIVLLGSCVILYLLRTFIHPTHVLHQLRTNLIETSCLSCISIVFTSILQLAVLQYGEKAGLAIYIMWWVNTGMAIIACLVIPFVHLQLQPSGARHIPAAALMPFLAALTSAAGGGTICRLAHISPRLQVPAIIISYLEVGAGLALAVGFDSIILFQYFDCVLQTAEKVYGDMILCGPFGQGSFALQALGRAVQAGSFAEYDRGQFLTGKAAIPIAFASHLVGLLVWGYGVFWWSFAIISICHALYTQPGGLKQTRFTLATWSVVFPWGVFTNAAVEFGKIMDSAAFAVVSTALLLLLLVIWITIQILTLKGIFTGRLLGLDHGWRRRRHDREHTEAKDV
ncbi:C4-dicarboxylate transporter/malic acid transport protein [Penicillium paradoxum]|uniref:C4-dicarboxylate transporter/malic acid transport protein n=1 Tax=Penicillium paradoxum TaxID=176176 RepID=UPI0025481915|nr:C4-dicarboxylate transporter/malic acid transport protein [Penicillium paradoxum]KAJ5774148.1 C4-dicarboxylate transporter/malic acid transport protein [Penicillium paradoxum]